MLLTEIVLVPEVAEKISCPNPDETKDAVGPRVRLPYIVLLPPVAPQMPEKPVRLMSRRAVPYRDRASLPAVILKLMLFASVPPAVNPASMTRVPVDPE